MKKADSGFSLIEVLVAFVVLALVLGVLMQIFSGGINNVKRSGEYQQAILLAQNTLESVGIEMPLRIGRFAGKYDEKYHWQIDMRPFNESVRSVELQGPDKEALLEVEVSVYWGDRINPQSVQLKTLRLSAGVTP